MNGSPLLVIFITVFIDLVGFGIVIPVLPYYIESERFHASPRLVGILFASYSAMQFIFTPVLGRLSDKYGRRPVLLLSIIGTGIGFLTVGAARSLWMLFAGRILDGITGGNISTAQAYIADVTTPENRAKGLGLIGAAFGLGFVFGPAIGGVLSGFGISAPFYFAAALAFANAILLYFTLPESLTPEARARAAARRKRDVWGEFKQLRLLLVMAIYFLMIVAFSIMTSAFALFTARRFDYNAQHNGYIFAFIGIIAVVAQLIIVRRVVPRFGENTFIIGGLVLFSAGLFLMPLVSPQYGGLTALLVATGMFSIGQTLAQPLLTSLASKSVGADVQGGVLGTLQSGSSLARVIGPLIGSALIVNALTKQIDDHSLILTFWTAAAIALIATLCSVYFAIAHDAPKDYATDENAPPLTVGD